MANEHGTIDPGVHERGAKRSLENADRWLGSVRFSTRDRSNNLFQKCKSGEAERRLDRLVPDPSASEFRSKLP